MKTDFERAIVYSLGVAALLLSGCDFNPVRPVQPGIDFFEGNNGTQDLVCHLDIPLSQPGGHTYDFTGERTLYKRRGPFSGPKQHRWRSQNIDF